jgi:hypothetical protein
MKNTFLTLTKAFAVIALVCTVQIAKADDPGNPGDVIGGGNGQSNPNAGVPVDGGASLLIAGGVAYGLKRLKKSKKA